MSTLANKVRSPFVFLRSVHSELRKVVWPTRSQLSSYTAVVVVFLVVMVALLAGVDAAVSTLALFLLG